MPRQPKEALTMDSFSFVLMMAMTPIPSGNARPVVGAEQRVVPERKLRRFGSFVEVVQADVQVDPGQAGPGAGQDKKTKTKSINFKRPTEGSSFKKVKDSDNKYYLDTHGDITGFTTPYPFLMGTLYSADRTKQWFPVTKKSPMMT